MKSFCMSAVLAGLLAFGTAQADSTGVWHNPDRNGEGISLIDRGETLVVYFYTYRDVSHPIPPTVSSEPPVVEPAQPNTSAWYLGVAEDFDGESASGIFYATEAFNYPDADDGAVASVEEVGRFTLVRDGDGWILEIDYSYNYLIPWHATVYGIHEFPTAIITKE